MLARLQIMARLASPPRSKLTPMRSRAVGLLFASVCLGSFAQTARRVDDPETEAADCHLVRASDLADPAAPSFRSFAADASIPAGHAKLDLSSDPMAREYRTVIRSQMRLGPNFAGHYSVVVWGCGSTCAMFAVVDVNTGRVITAPSTQSVSGTSIAADNFLTEGFSDGEWWAFRYRKDSRLLILVGTINEDDERTGAFYYVLTNNRLKLVHATLAKKKACPGEVAGTN